MWSSGKVIWNKGTTMQIPENGFTESIFPKAPSDSSYIPVNIT